MSPICIAVPLPARWSYVQGAAAILGLMTEHNALATAGRMQAGEVVVVHAAASSVGLQACRSHASSVPAG